MDTKEQTTQKAKTIMLEGLKSEQFIVQKDERLNCIFLGTEGAEGCTKFLFELHGRGAEVHFYGFIIGRGAEKFHFETISHHLAAETKAYFHLRAALFDESLVDYKGNLRIEKSAQLADTYLAHHTLLLSDKARARTIPALEIEADDVKAGHAATIGKVDKELLFYLQSRGLDPKRAEQLLIGGFFETQLQMIPNEVMRDDLRKKIIVSLPFSV